MKNLEKMLELADNELGAIASNGKFRSREEIDSVEKLVKMAKSIYCIWEMEDDGGMSYADGGYYRGGRVYRGVPYEGDSYARGRTRNVKRDSLGRYARDGGYSYHDDYVTQLHDLMDTAPDEHTRQSIQRMIDNMKNA